MYLLDTNAISEIIKPSPNKEFIQWLYSIPKSKLCLSVITIGEIRKGIEKLEDSLRKQKIISWLEIDLIKEFNNRIIDIDKNIADKWGYLCAITNIPAIDGLIGATALVHDLKLVTRNIKDFLPIIGLEIINPWNS